MGSEAGFTCGSVLESDEGVDTSASDSFLVPDELCFSARKTVMSWLIRFSGHIFKVLSVKRHIHYLVTIKAIQTVMIEQAFYRPRSH